VKRILYHTFLLCKVTHPWGTYSVELSASWGADSHLTSEGVPTFCGTLRFFIMFARTYHWSLSWAIWIQSTLSHSVSLWSVLILSCHLCLSILGSLSPSDIWQEEKSEWTVKGDFPSCTVLEMAEHQLLGCNENQNCYFSCLWRGHCILMKKLHLKLLFKYVKWKIRDM
jgi:hypothetical protein